MEVKSSENRASVAAVMCWALIPAGVWAGAMKIIGASVGAHSTAGVWGVIVGFPGDMLGAWIGQWTNSDPAFYAGAFLGIWLFWFGLFKAAVALKHKLRRSP